MKPAASALALALALALASVSAAAAPPVAFRIVGSWPHDPAAFTQGLVFARGRLYESTGLRGHSGVREVEPASGRVLRLRPLLAPLFGEGLALVGDRFYQLTWQAGRAFVYRASDLHPVATVRYRGEGWGLAFDGRDLLMSDGTATVVRRAPGTFAPRGRFMVRDDGQPVTRLNELEFARGRLYANVWYSDRIARIDPDSGAVDGWIDLAVLRRTGRAGERAGVLNGIAWDEARGQLLVTGKRWSRVFVIEFAR